MRQSIAVVEAHSTADFARRAHHRRLGGKTVLEWVVRRASESHRLGAVVVAADPSLDVERLRQALPLDVPLFQHPAADSLTRLVALIDAYQPRGIVRLNALNPLIDADLIDRLIAMTDEDQTCDYVGYCSRQPGPPSLSSLGIVAEWCRAESLRQADRLCKTAAERKDATRFLHSHPEHFVGRFVPVPSELDRHDLRLTIEHEEDWEHAEAIFDALGHDRLDWQEITGFLHHQPGIRKRMAALNRGPARV